MEVCPLCYNQSFQPEVQGPKGRYFYLCDDCNLVFEERSNLPDLNEEKERYLEHENSIHQEGYVKHLNQAIKPALPYINTDYRGLDYGCGPVPTLNRLLEREGYYCEFYDPIFFPEYPQGNYDFIFATECFEHFFRPGDEMLKLSGLLKPGGVLAVMTQLWADTGNFKDWGYAHDPTHVAFYHNNTFQFIAENFGFKILKNNKERVVILRKL